MGALFIAEIRSDKAPANAAEVSPMHWFDGFPAGRPLVEAPARGPRARVVLRPTPVRARLPQRDEREIWIAGYPSLELSGWPGGAAILTAHATVLDTATTPRSPNAASFGIDNPGILVPEGKKPRLGEALDRLSQRSSPRQSQLLDLRSVLDHAAIEVSAKWRKDGTYLALSVSGGSEVQRARLLVMIDEDGTGTALTAINAFEGILDGDTKETLLVSAEVRGSLPAVNELLAEMVLAVEHCIAHRWLLARCAFLNDRQMRVVHAYLHASEMAPTEISTRRRETLAARTEFLGSVDPWWTLGQGLPMGTRALVSQIDDGIVLSGRWRREQRRFDRLEALLEHAAGLEQDPPPRPRPSSAAQKRMAMRNPIAQFLDWWTHRGNEVAEERIELHPYQNRLALMQEMNAGIAMTTFMTAASLIFLGVVIGDASGTNGGHIPKVVGPDIDILFLFVASFAFLLSTLMYANLAGRIARHGTAGFERRLEFANSLSEYFGVYSVILALPLVVSRFLKTGFISISVAVLAVTSLVIYHYSPGSSILERGFGERGIGTDWARNLVIVPILVLGATAMFVGQLIHCTPAKMAGFGVLAALMIMLGVLSLAAPDRPEPRNYAVDAWDELGQEQHSLLDAGWRARRDAERTAHAANAE